MAAPRAPRGAEAIGLRWCSTEHLQSGRGAGPPLQQRYQGSGEVVVSFHALLGWINRHGFDRLTEFWTAGPSWSWVRAVDPQTGRIT